MAEARHPSPALAPLDEVLPAGLFPQRAARLEETAFVLLAPNDLLATRACGVNFVRSLLERVVEEKARVKPERAGCAKSYAGATCNNK